MHESAGGACQQPWWLCCSWETLHLPRHQHLPTDGAPLCTTLHAPLSTTTPFISLSKSDRRSRKSPCLGGGGREQRLVERERGSG